VSVDDIAERFDDVALPVPPHGEMIIPIDAVGSFIQCPQKISFLITQSGLDTLPTNNTHSQDQ
jgi:hypothetical protein